jgi:hypothetical protein
MLFLMSLSTGHTLPPHSWPNGVNLLAKYMNSMHPLLLLAN